MISTAQRYPAIDYLKAVAIVAVTMTHAGPNILQRGVALPLFVKISSVATSFHVPAFLFAAGFLATRAAPAGWRDVANRLQRILVPYLVATAVALAFGYWHAASLPKVAFVILTGAGVGTYYFIPALASCFLLLPILSRLPTRGLVSLVVVLAVYAHVAREWPQWRLSYGMFWGVRDIFAQFHLGQFVLGMVAMRMLPTLESFTSRWQHAIPIACVAIMAGFIWYSVAYFIVGWRPLNRTFYMLSIAALLGCMVPRRAPPAFVRFLSEATLTIYLYHLFVYPLVGHQTRMTLPPPLRIALLTGLGLGSSILLVLAGRRVLGRRSRLILGA